jgi:enoyl-[acyl-carrier protein] reductase I
MPSRHGARYHHQREQVMQTLSDRPLAGMHALVTGVANAESIAYGCARAFADLGAQLTLTYLNDKAKPHVEPLAQELGAKLLLPLDVEQDAQMDAVFDAIRTTHGTLDIVLHSIAHAPKADLQGGLLGSSAQGFAQAMDVSCHSFIRMAKRASLLMPNGGTLFAMSYDGANRVVPNYSLMGPVKAALEASCRYLAYELGSLGIRVHAISPGPLKTRAASGLPDFDRMLADAVERAPLGELVDIMDVGYATAYLATRYARRMSGNTIYIDGGAHIMA